MQRILRKRVWRELKENLLRYFALCCMILLGMYLIVSLVGAAETVITGVDRKGEANKLEDGQFRVFVPLSEVEEDSLTGQGISLERMFYLDFQQEAEDRVLRLFQNRKMINLLELEQGRQSSGRNEVVLEKRFCEENNLSVGDNIKIGKESFQIAGIGTVPDYDAMFRNLSDSSVDSQQFGLAFVSTADYDRILQSGSSVKSEEYVYAYRLNGTKTDNAFKKELMKLELEAETVQDPYFQEYWDQTAGKKEEMEDGIQKLSKGSGKLSKGLKRLTGQNDVLQQGAEKIWDVQIKDASNSLAEYGLKEELNEENFEQVLGSWREQSDNPALCLHLESVLEQLKELRDYKEGIAEYTDKTAKSAEGAEDLSEGIGELKVQTDEWMDAFFDTNKSNLIQFLKSSDNPRMKASANDQVINKLAGLIAGIIVMILFTYVISVFVIHEIEKESSVIGALYALGVRKWDLILHYLMLPVLVTFLAGAAGTVLGFSKWGVNYQMQNCYDYFSVPTLQTAYPFYLIVYGIVMPPVVAAIVNCFVIQKRLSRPALKLIRNEQKNGRVHNINLRNLGFIGRFRIRQMIREARTGVTVLFGLFIALLIMMLGINCYVMCKHISKENRADTKFEYMYTYKYPEEDVPEGGEACYARTLKKEIYGYNLDVTLLGIREENPYFDTQVTDGKNEVILSSAMAQKYQLSEGDRFLVSDEEKEMDYVFHIRGITQYSSGLYMFMDRNTMRQLFGETEDYYNVILSDRKLDIDSGRLYAITTKKEISQSADIFTSMMMPLIAMLTGVSSLVFCVVMYLMMKVMIDRSAFSISLIKIFGYRTREIRKLYLNGNFYVIAIGASIAIPLSKKLIDIIYPLLVSNVACGMNLSFSPGLYLGIYGIIIGLYLIINRLLLRRLKKINPAEVLKSNE